MAVKRTTVVALLTMPGLTTAFYLLPASLSIRENSHDFLGHRSMLTPLSARKKGLQKSELKEAEVDGAGYTAEKRAQQQSYALGLFFVACIYDFFVTHHGVGFWDPNYVL